jgi:hypothetical protein
MGEGQLNVTFETSRDIIERILRANYVESFKAVISYSNRDETELFASLIEEKTKGDNIERLEINAKSAKGEKMQVQPDGFISAATTLAQSNGYAIAVIAEGEKNKKTRIDTTDHPMKENIEAKLSELRSEIYSLLKSKFKPKS